MNIKCFLLESTDKIKQEYDENGKITSSTHIYKRIDTGEEMTLNNAPVGAIWRAEWYEDIESYTGTDGKSYVCKTPGGIWMIDGRASNCTRIDDDIHKCWCRHGDAPNFTVDKNGNTCAAGSGSIILGSYHGFLINGELTNC